MKKVLVVDDSPVVRSFHMNILKIEGFLAEGAADGMEALEKALQHRYDLILCDINMPNMDGLTFITAYREEVPDGPPVIILTTQEEEANRKKGYASGANLYLVKPVAPHQLTQHIKLLMGEKAE